MITLVIYNFPAFKSAQVDKDWAYIQVGTDPQKNKYKYYLIK